MKQEPRPSGIPGLHLKDGRVSLQEQLYRGIRKSILNGTLVSGARLPSTRAVATFYSVVQPYVKNDQVPRCPSDDTAIDIPALIGAPCVNTPRYSGFVTNSDLFTFGEFPGSSAAAPITLAAVGRPAETIALYDGNSAFAGSIYPLQVAQARHQSAFDASYVDGHVKSIQATEDTSLPATKQYRSDGKDVTLKRFRIGANGGIYVGRVDARGIAN